MVLNHVAQRAGLFIISASTFNTDRLGVCNLNVIDVLPVPQRLENAVGKTEGENILNGFFAEIMINSINLFLSENPGQLFVQSTCACQIVTERFLDDDARPGFLLWFGNARLTQFPGNQCEVVRRGGEIKNAIASSLVFAVYIFQLRL